MRTFKDVAGREWQIEVNAWSVGRVRKLANVDLANAGVLMSQVADPVTFVNVLWVLVERQATAADVTDEDFGRAMNGAELNAAADALVEAVADFLPLETGAGLRKLWAKGGEAARRNGDALIAAIDQLDPTTL
jgi:hypothetical protein